MTDYNLWKNDITNRFSPTSLTNAVQGSGFVATSVISSVTTNSAYHMSLFDAYLDLRLKLLNGDDTLLPTSTTTQRDALSGIDQGTHLYNITIGRDEVYNGTAWVGVDAVTFHAEIHDEDNTSAFIIHAQNEHHAYHSSSIAVGDVEGWTFNAGSAGTDIVINSIADATGGNITVTTNTPHGLAIGDIICQTGLSDSAYVGSFIVLTVPTTTTYTVTATYTATGTGFMCQPSYIQANSIAAGHYMLTWTASLSVVGTGVTFDFFLHDGVSVITGSKGRHKMANAAAFKMIGGQAVRNVVSGDRIFLALSNITNATNLTIRDFSLIAVKL